MDTCADCRKNEGGRCAETGQRVNCDADASSCPEFEER